VDSFGILAAIELETTAAGTSVPGGRNAEVVEAAEETCTAGVDCKVPVETGIWPAFSDETTRALGGAARLSLVTPVFRKR